MLITSAVLLWGLFRGALKNNLFAKLGILSMLGTTAKQKKRFNSGIARIGGGGLPLPEFFCALFLLKEKVSSMVATAERVGKVALWGARGKRSN